MQMHLQPSNMYDKVSNLGFGHQAQLNMARKFSQHYVAGQ